MQTLSIENIFGFSDQRFIDTVRPKPRPVRLPWWLLIPVVASVILAVLRADGTETTRADWLWPDRIVFGLAALGVCVVAFRFEERIFSALRATHVAARLFVAAFVVASGILISAGLVATVREIPLAGDRLAALLLVFAFWMASAAVGSLVMLVLDVLLRTLVSDFRRRIILAVLGLLALAFALCGYVAVRAMSWLEATQSRGSPPQSLSVLGYSLQDLPFAKTFMAQPSAFALAAFVAAAVVTLPAVLSVCAKLAETVMERITPLLTAFDRVASGDRSVHLEEAGSQEFLTLALSFNEMVDKLYLAERIERAFGQYVSNQVLDRIRAQKGAVRLPAELRTASVFFADIRGFTPISEHLTPAAVVDLLNRYLEAVVPVVEQHQGFLNKFVGDAVVVVFNGPLEQPDHAERATRCAIAVQQLVAQLNAQGAFAEVGKLEIGVGVATGPMLCGNIGTRSRLEYTVIGDTVNLASRMTGHARGGEVWVSEMTARRLPPVIPAVPYEPIKFKGKDRAVVPYCVWPPMQAGVMERRGRSS